MSDVQTCPKCGDAINRVDDFVKCTKASPCPVAHTHAHNLGSGFHGMFNSEAAYLKGLLTAVIAVFHKEVAEVETTLHLPHAANDPPPPAGVPSSPPPEVSPAAALSGGGGILQPEPAAAVEQTRPAAVAEPAAPVVEPVAVVPNAAEPTAPSAVIPVVSTPAAPMPDSAPAVPEPKQP